MCAVCIGSEKPGGVQQESLKGRALCDKGTALAVFIVGMGFEGRWFRVGARNTHGMGT